MRGELGIVENLREDGGGFLLQLVRNRKRVLIPFVAPYIERIDVERGEIELRLPEGLLDVCTSGS